MATATPHPAASYAEPKHNRRICLGCNMVRSEKLPIWCLNRLTVIVAMLNSLTAPYDQRRSPR